MYRTRDPEMLNAKCSPTMLLSTTPTDIIMQIFTLGRSINLYMLQKFFFSLPIPPARPEQKPFLILLTLLRLLLFLPLGHLSYKKAAEWKQRGVDRGPGEKDPEV